MIMEEEEEDSQVAGTPRELLSPQIERQISDDDDLLFVLAETTNRNVSWLSCISFHLFSRPALPHQLWLVVIWLAVVLSADCLYAVTLWRGCRSASASAWASRAPSLPAADETACRGRGWVPIAGLSLV